MGEQMSTMKLGWEIFDHPPYSPDLAPSDFHLFTKLKDFLGGTRFGSDEELKKTVNTWLNELAAEEYNTGILKLVNRYDKCLNVGGDYVENAVGKSEHMYARKLLAVASWFEESPAKAAPVRWFSIWKRERDRGNQYKRRRDASLAAVRKDATPIR
ncbi:hypothetical protein ANN_23163 [Periplaneta americana]|uniref:Histone-lysine N-methyltransferase SETMAR n=1 Tax=Periplaneta americana TaxID=6978 RepID=A0ABQ8SLL3_PERAM|nr:hypothetical protein ANN_23163 [Periplaneta americana]